MNRATRPAAGYTGTTTQQDPKSYEAMVSNFLVTRGLLRTEAVFREETGRLDSRELDTAHPVTTHTLTEVALGLYTSSFASFSEWVHSSLDLYRVQTTKNYNNLLLCSKNL
jgi:hypothetical protein